MRPLAVNVASTMARAVGRFGALLYATLVGYMEGRNQEIGAEIEPSSLQRG